MANLALTAYMRREHQDSFTIWQHVIVPWVATLALIPVLVVTVWPIPAWPYDLVPYVFIVLMLAGFPYMRWLELRNPGALQRGATMLVGSRTSSEGDVDWSKSS